MAAREAGQDNRSIRSPRTVPEWMESVEYERMHASEDTMWWYQAVHDRLVDALRQHPGPSSSAVLDAGCGTGGLLKRLANESMNRDFVGIDVFQPAVDKAARKSGAAVAVASANRLPFGSASLGAVFSVDVICHRLVDPRQALAEAYRCLLPGGALIVNVPTYPWLMSFHDRQVHNSRRFARRSLLGLLREAGFENSRADYWNCLLFPLMVLRRKLFKPAASSSDVVEFGGLANRCFGAVLVLERVGARLGLRYPFGGSLLAVAVKPGGPNGS